MAQPTLRRLGNLLTNGSTVFASIGLGVVIGIYRPGLATALAPYGAIYLALIKMCVLPLMMVALVSSLGQLLYSGHAERYVGRIALVFCAGMVLAAVLGTALAAWTGPGRQIDDATRLQLAQEVLRVELSGAAEDSAAPGAGTGLLTFIRAMIPENVFAAASGNSVLSVVFFCVLTGVALGSLRSEQALAALQVANAGYEAMLQVIGWLMYALPFGLASLVADQVSHTGGAMLTALVGLVATMYAGALTLILIYVAVVSLRTGKGPLASLGAVREPLLVAMGTSSSFAAIPAALRSVNGKLGCERQAGDLVVPLGVTLSPHGTVLHFSIAAVFVAQLYPWVCGRCARVFDRINLRELTVHHKDMNHDRNPPDGSNWELLCLYCHDNEHQRYEEHLAALSAGHTRPAPGGGKQTTHNPFAGLGDLLKKE